MHMKPIKLSKLLVFVLVTELIGFLGSILGGSTKELYRSLVKPPFAPPGWLFAIAWIVLYLLIGIGAYLFSTEGPGAPDVLKIYWAQLILNALWPLLFFRLHFYTAAAFLIGILIVLTALLMLRGRRLSSLATLFFLPYLLWLCYALYLNIGIVLLN